VQEIQTNEKSLHSIRGIAALIIVIFHAKFVLWCGGNEYIKINELNSFFDYVIFSLDMLSSCGVQCVLIFFALSAFVIKSSYIRNQYKVAAFYKIRLIRIYIPFLFSVFLSIFILIISVKFINPEIISINLRKFNTGISDSYSELSIYNLIKTLFFIRGKNYTAYNNVYWSLFHELVFYILFPLYFKLKKLPLILIFSLFAFLYIIYENTICFYQLFFIAGLFFFDYFQKNKIPLLKNKILQVILILVSYTAINIFLNFKLIIFADLLTLLVSFISFDLILNHQLKIPAYLMKLGDISYSLYLNHFPILILLYAFYTLIFHELVFYSRLPYYSGIFVAIIFTIPIYYFIERPSLKYILKLKSKNKQLFQA
jgi:peptidoglycan/LPS O-acetylase OafA/YrhL